jgi:inhibitor of cysteine peptidase
MFAIDKPLLSHPRAVPILATLALAVMVLAGCASHKDTEPAAVPAGARENGVLVLTRVDNNRTAAVRVGERIEARLPENPTTGFAWAIDETSSRRLALDGTDYTPPVESGFIGTRGQRTFRFTARQPGEVALKFKYWRVWEGDASIKERFAVTLQISD